MCDNDIIIFFNKFKKFSRWDLLEKKYNDIYIYLINRYKDSKSPKESYYRILNNLEIRPTCKICNKEIIFDIRANKFLDTCSKECQYLLINKKINEFNLIHYNCNNYFASDKFKKENKENNLKLYNVEYNWQRSDIKEKIKQTCLEKYGVENGGGSKQAQEKIKQTTYLHYGVNCSLQSEEIRNKGKQTCLEKYGVENGGGSKQAQEKIKQTTYLHYSVNCSLQSEEIRNKGKQTCLEKYGYNYPIQNSYIKEKLKKTCFERYNAYTWQQSNEGRQYLSIKNSSKEVQDKINNTKRLNNSFNKSKQEIYILNKLKEKFINVKYQYKSKLYPFRCDFYIPQIDLYIEYNGNWTHGFHLYNENNEEDKKILNKWIEKSKEHKYYMTAINVWTKRDLLKYNTAIKNNLKYKIFYNLNEFNNWFENI